MCLELKEHQPPLNSDEQIANLKSKGLLIPDEDYAKSILNDISYFRLIKAYSLGLKPKNGNYIENISFNDIVELYLFDSNFRQLLFPLIEKVEINLRCRIANYFCEKYGVLGYEDINNFAITEDMFCAFSEEIQKEITRNSRSPFIKNFQDNYKDGKIPLYALVEILSFGTLSKFYKNMKNEDKKAVAKLFGTGYTYFESWIESISYVRNICAHYGRLYNAKLTKTPILYKQYTEIGIKNNRLFATLICLKHLLPNDRHWSEFVENISNLLYKYSKVDKFKIGFTDTWEDVLNNKIN